MSTPKLRIVWVGFHEEGILTLEALIRGELPATLVGAVTLTNEAANRRSATVDVAGMVSAAGIPVLQVDKINNDDAVRFIRGSDPDLVVALGWSQILSSEILSIPAAGVLGAHASLLPHNRGSAPVNWAIIRGESHGGNTLMWLGEGVDDGDIVAQRSFPILDTDTCATVYKKVAVANREMLTECLESLVAGVRPGRPQAESEEPLLPRRKPDDGLIDWSWSAKRVYDFVRGLTRPYPGAFTFADGVRVNVWEAARLPGSCSLGAPGTVVGSVVSPNPSIGGWVVACGSGAVILTDFEMLRASESMDANDRVGVLNEGLRLGA